MKLLRNIFFILFFFNSASHNLFAQQPKTIADSIETQIEMAGLQKPSSTLFVHFDKAIYSNNENVWFTGYLVKTNTRGVHHTLSVALIRNDDRSVMAEGKYVMDKGLAFGNMVLPDSLPTGNYSLLCYTNLMINGYPSALFVQPITIKSGDASSFTATLNLTDSIKPGMDSATVLLKAMMKDYTLVKKAAVRYFVGGRPHPLLTGTLKTDNFGEVQMKIPLKEIDPTNNILQAEITNGTTIKNFSIKLPVYKKETLVRFYPEGGHLIEGAPNTVGWEVMNNEGEPVAVKAELYEGDKQIQSVNTSVYGMGKFIFLPEKDKHYYVKLQNPATDSLYMLPQILAGVPVITVPNALTADTLLVNVETQGDSAKLLLLVHDYQTVFINAPLAIQSKTTRLKIPLTGIPKGIATLTLLDTLGRPVAERLFFAHFDKRAIATISTDSTTYTGRKKVMVKLKLADADHHPLVGLVSVACVQNNRLDLVKTMNIESFTYLTNALTDISVKRNLISNDADNTAFLEQVLLIKGWRKYTWQDMAMAKATDTAAITSLSFKGKVVMYQKALKKPVQLNIKKFVTAKLSELDIIATDNSGHFEIPAEKIITEPGRKIEVSVHNDRQEEYTVTMDNPYRTMNKALAASLVFPDYSPRSFAQSSQAFVLKAGEVAKTLKVVVVNSQKDNRWYSSPRPGTNVCGDYVCMNNILNCTNHPNDRYEPVVGRSYGVRSFGSNVVTQTVYYGCTALTQATKNEYLFSMDGIYNNKEFYVTDLTKADISDPQYLSTIYWNYSVVTNANGEAELAFYTGDIPGKFRIVVQGVVTDNVVYGEQFFEVKGE